MDRVKTCSIWVAILLGAFLMVPTQSFAQTYIGVYGGVNIPHDADATLLDPVLLGPLPFPGKSTLTPR